MDATMAAELRAALAEKRQLEALRDALALKMRVTINKLIDCNTRIQALETGHRVETYTITVSLPTMTPERAVELLGKAARLG